MKRLIIIFAILIILVGGGISIMRTLQLGPFANTGEKHEDEKKDPQKALSPVPLFVEMDPLYIPILDGDRVIATVQIQLRLEALTLANEAAIRKALPRLSDTFLRDLYGFLPRLIHRQQTVDVIVVRERLEFIAARMLGKGVVNAVLIQSMSDASAQPPRAPAPGAQGQTPPAGQAAPGGQGAPAGQPAAPAPGAQPAPARP